MAYVIFFVPFLGLEVVDLIKNMRAEDRGRGVTEAVGWPGLFLARQLP